MRRAKIVCTIGPATKEKAQIAALVAAGMNVARLNFSHGSYSEHAEVMGRIKEVRKERSMPLGIMLDTKGPELRLGEFEERLVFPEEIIRLVKEVEEPGDIPLLPSHVIDEVAVGGEVLINDGYVMGRVTGKGSGYLEIEIANEGVIKSRKSVTFLGVHLSLPFMTERDVADISFGVKEGVEMIAASFVRAPEDILAIKDLLRKLGAPSIMVLAKIETRQAVDNFDAIVQVADGIMIARGDLGVELPLSEVPGLQKVMIRKANLAAKPVLTATQMLESMIYNPRPTRAEVADVANAILDGSSALMLSGETAAGKYPIQAVKMMCEVIIDTERYFDYQEFFYRDKDLYFHDVGSAIALSAVTTAYSIEARLILISSQEGHSVKRISRYHPKAALLAVTSSWMAYHQTSLMWGASAVIDTEEDLEKSFKRVSCYALQHKWAAYGDLVVLTTGQPHGRTATTNTIMVRSIGGALVRGLAMKASDFLPSVITHVLEGSIAFLISPEARSAEELKDKIVVITRCDDSYESHLRGARAIVLQNSLLDSASETVLQQIFMQDKIPFITRAQGALSLLSEGLDVRLYPTLGLLFRTGSPTENELLSPKD